MRYMIHTLCHEYRHVILPKSAHAQITRAEKSVLLTDDMPEKTLNVLLKKSGE